ncbi:MAG: helix-turn-helix domain-containing protein [Sciscionella sp.]
MRAPDPGASEIGQRVRMIRKRRGLSLDAVAGLAGISKPYLSHLETGKRNFERRSLLENLAAALGCSVADLTGQPYLPPDRVTAEGKRAITRIEQGCNDATLQDVPDLRPRSLDELRRRVERNAGLRDAGQYGIAAEDADRVLVELQVHVATSTGRERRDAAELVTFAAYNAFVVATTYGYFHLAQHAARRAYDAAMLTDRPELAAFAMFARAPSIARNGGRHRAARLLDRSIAEAEALTAIRDEHTTGAEMYGLLHLMGAHWAARAQDADSARTHLDEATRVARLTGERNGFHQHFGPTNVQVWQVAIGTELGDGPAAAERVEREPVDVAVLDSTDRTAALYRDLARAYGQAEGARDAEAIRHLDAADRLAPQRIRQDPLARELVAALSRRARRRVWELDSLRHRFGVG